MSNQTLISNFTTATPTTPYICNPVVISTNCLPTYGNTCANGGTCRHYNSENTYDCSIFEYCNVQCKNIMSCGRAEDNGFIQITCRKYCENKDNNNYLVSSSNKSIITSSFIFVLISLIASIF